MQVSEIKRLRALTVPTQSNVIGGQATAASKRLEVISPIDGSILTDIPASSASDIDSAVAVARAAFVDGRWRAMPPARRKQIMSDWADLIEKEALSLAVLGVRDNGTELPMALKAEPGSAAQTIRYYGETCDKIGGEVIPSADNRLCLSLRKPIGVVAALVPWNFPLMIGAWKFAPAIAMGNSVVLKPSETASLTLLRVAELALDAGLPDGVFNVVTGSGQEAGAALAGHNDVDALLFTGSGGTGRRLLAASANSNMKPVYLELGGKSAHVIFDDADTIEAAAKDVVAGIFRNSGQTCVAGSRLIVHRDIKDQLLARVVEIASTLKVGDPLDLDNDIGAVHSADQLARNLNHVEQAQEAGANLVLGGHSLHDQGYYMAPTIFDDVKASDNLFQEEVFGPVLTVTSFETDEEALSLANATQFGLAGGVWTSNLTRAHRMVNEMQAGVVHVNGYGGTDVTIPMGGIKQSGYGYDRSLRALDQVSHMKSAVISI